MPSVISTGTPNQAEIVGAQELYFAALGFVCMVVSWFKLRPVHAAWITGNWFLVTSVTFMESVPRYVLTMYPVFMLFALLSRNRLCDRNNHRLVPAFPSLCSAACSYAAGGYSKCGLAARVACG